MALKHIARLPSLAPEGSFSTDYSAPEPVSFFETAISPQYIRPNTSAMFRLVSEA